MRGLKAPNENSYFFKIVRNALLLILFEGVILFFVGRNSTQYLYGLLLGGFASILFFRLLFLNIIKIMDLKIKNVHAYIFSNYIARFVLTGCILYISATNERINLFTCFLGLLSIKIVIHIQNVWEIYLGKNKKM